MYNAVMNAIRDGVRAGTQNTRPMTEFIINRLDADDLMKLTYSDLVALNYAQDVAEEVSAALVHANLVPLGRNMGVEFKLAADVPSLLDN